VRLVGCEAVRLVVDCAVSLRWIGLPGGAAASPVVDWAVSGGFLRARRFSRLRARRISRLRARLWIVLRARLWIVLQARQWIGLLARQLSGLQVVDWVASLVWLRAGGLGWEQWIGLRARVVKYAGLEVNWRRIVVAVAMSSLLLWLLWLCALAGSCCAGDGYVVRCYCGEAAAIIMTVGLVVAAAACRACCGSRPIQMYKTINLFWTAIMFAGAIVRKSEFIVVSYRLMLHDFF
jgi:hypothetical protein